MHNEPERWLPPGVRLVDRLADIMLAVDDVRDLIDEAPLSTDLLRSADDLMQRIWGDTNDLMKKMTD